MDMNKLFPDPIAPINNQVMQGALGALMGVALGAIPFLQTFLLPWFQTPLLDIWKSLPRTTSYSPYLKH
jgi:hypothetical protein